MKMRRKSPIVEVVQWVPDNPYLAGNFASVLAIAQIPFQIKPDLGVLIWQGQDVLSVSANDWVIIEGKGKAKIMGEAELVQNYEEVPDEV